MVVWECQLKPAVREETLAGIVYLLNEAFLDLYRSKTLPVQPYAMEEEHAAMAAEGDTTYGNHSDR